MNRSRFFENTILEVVQRTAAQVKASPLFLGSGNGVPGTPPAPIVGQLAQSYILYDTNESFYAGTNTPSSLLDNLAHIRNQIKTDYEECLERSWWGW